MEGTTNKNYCGANRYGKKAAEVEYRGLSHAGLSSIVQYIVASKLS